MQLLDYQTVLSPGHAMVVLTFEHDGIVAETAVTVCAHHKLFIITKPDWGRVVSRPEYN